MTEGQEQPQQDKPEKPHKACQISLMFPVENDDEAMVVKHAIDTAVPDVEGKRYTFQIIEM